MPANQFEVVECAAALEATMAGELDGEPRGPGPRDVLCQHILITACAGPFAADDLYAQVTSTGSFATLTRAAFDTCLEFCATGGYALRSYDRWQRLLLKNGKWQLRDPRSSRIIRMNIGTIQDTEKLKVRMKGKRTGVPLGEIEEGFAATLSAGDTFLIGGRIVKYEGLRELTVEVSRATVKKPRVASFMGTKFATSTQLSAKVQAILARDGWPELPRHTTKWLSLQRHISQLPQPGRMLIESFPHEGIQHTAFYGFAGRNGQQTLGLLLTREMEELGLHPLGFVATDYATLVWGLDEIDAPGDLLTPATLDRGLDAWLSRQCRYETYLSCCSYHCRADRKKHASISKIRAPSHFQF